jgi:hypothetical protein
VTSASSVDHEVVYFARDRLPPVAAHVDGAAAGVTSVARTLARMRALFVARAPAGLFNAALSSLARPLSADVADDVVTIDFAVPSGDWVAGSATVRAFIQQLAYTATEEPTLPRALFTWQAGALA